MTNVTGSIQPSKGTYYAVLNLRDENGKSVPKWINSHIPVKPGNKRKADEFLRQQIELWNQRQGIYSGTGFAEYLEFWLTTIEDDIRPNTYRGYCGNMNNHIIPYFKAHPIKLQDVTPLDLEEYYYSLLKPESNLISGTALSSTTIHHHHQNISKALSDAVRKGLIIANPASSAKLPKRTPYRPNFMNKEQVEDMIKLFAGSPIELPVLLCAVYGFRRSEALGLKWQRVDFHNKTISIFETLQQSAGDGDYADIPKTDSSYRTMPMTKRVEEALRKQKTIQEGNRRLMGAYYSNSDYVCTRPDGTVLSPNYVSRTFHSVIIKSEMPYVTLHQLRHSSASNLLSQGFSVVQVQEWLGHSSAETTLGYYAHADKTSKMQIANSLDEDDEKRRITETENKKEKPSDGAIRKVKIPQKVKPQVHLINHKKR